MKVYAFGEENAPVILLLPGTCCHWKGNFGHVIPLLSDEYRVLCVSYDGFDETERTEFPTMLEETAKIEDYNDLRNQNVRKFFRFLSKVGDGMMNMQIVRLDFAKENKKHE